MISLIIVEDSNEAYDGFQFNFRPLVSIIRIQIFRPEIMKLYIRGKKLSSNNL